MVKQSQTSDSFKIDNTMPINPQPGGCPGCGRCMCCGRPMQVGPYVPGPYEVIPTWAGSEEYVWHEALPQLTFTLTDTTGCA